MENNFRCKHVYGNIFISSHSTLESLWVMTLAITKAHKPICCSEVLYGPLSAAKTCALGISTWSDPTTEYLKPESSQRSLETSQVFKIISLVTTHRNASVLSPQKTAFLFSHCNTDILHCWNTIDELIISSYMDIVSSPTPRVIVLKNVKIHMSWQDLWKILSWCNLTVH